MYNKKKFFSLNKDPVNTLKIMYSAYERFSVFLFFGYCTEKKYSLYSQIFKKILSCGKQILVMVPEKKTIAKIVTFFKKEFSVPIKILHSSINKNKKLNTWMQSYNDENIIVIGTRIALFIPFFRLGIIVLEEEHDDAYKEKKFRYHARDLAVIRAKKENIPILISSLTPTFESLFNVLKGKYKKINFNLHTKNTKLITTTLIDVKEVKSKIELSDVAIQKIQMHLNSRYHVLLFFHRKNFFSTLICDQCSWKPHCKKCDHVYFIYKIKKMHCHSCNDIFDIPKKCMQCNATYLALEGLNNERLEIEFKKIFPNSTLRSIDRNMLLNFQSIHYTKIKKIGNTFLLTENQDLPRSNIFYNIKLVLFFDVDSILFSCNFRSSEKLAQIYHQLLTCMTQSKKTCEILLHTHYPQYPILKKLISLDYINFAKKELKNREKFSLPPFSYHAIFRTEDVDLNKSVMFLKKIHVYFTEINKLQDQKIYIIGPMPSYFEKRNNKYRWQLLFQHSSRLFLQKILNTSLKKIHAWSKKYKIKWILDIDPVEY